VRDPDHTVPGQRVCKGACNASFRLDTHVRTVTVQAEVRAAPAGNANVAVAESGYGVTAEIASRHSGAVWRVAAAEDAERSTGTRRVEAEHAASVVGTAYTHGTIGGAPGDSDDSHAGPDTSPRAEADHAVSTDGALSTFATIADNAVPRKVTARADDAVARQLSAASNAVHAMARLAAATPRSCL
jgi:hypothetical protein